MPACGLPLKRNCPFLSLVPGRVLSFGIDAATSVRNLIEDKPALSVIGSPLYGGNYIELTGAQVITWRHQ